MLVIVAVLAGGASAENPRTVALARDRAAMLDGRATARLAEGMAVLSSQASAVLDWGATRFAMVPSIGPGPGPDLRDLVASDRELGSARPERLPSDGPGGAFGAAPNLPRLENGRALVYVAYLSAPEKAVAVFRFYVSEDGIDDARAWATLARAIAATIKVRVAPSSQWPHLAAAAKPPHVRLPAGWSVTSNGASQRVVSDRGTCDVHDGELDARPTAPGRASHVAGKMRGVAMYWSVWSDRAGHHAETMVGAARLGQVHVRCHARGAAELARQRDVVEALWQQ